MKRKVWWGTWTIMVLGLAGCGDNTAAPPGDDSTACAKVGFPGPPQVGYLVGYYGGSLDPVASDLDGDGHLDLVFADASPARLVVARGLGDGAFAAPTLYSLAGSYPEAMVAGDLDGDGRLDVVVVTYSRNAHLDVMLGQPGGAFAAPAMFPITVPPGRPWYGPSLIQLGDLDGDGHPDVVLQGLDSVGVMINDGHGAFAQAAPIATGGAAAGVLIADLDGDGLQDLAATHPAPGLDGGTVIVRFATGNGGFAAPVDFPAGPNPKAIRAADFDGDGKLDLVVAGVGVANLLRGTGGRGFAAPTAIKQSSVRVPGDYTDDVVLVAITDVNGDGLLDLVTHACVVLGAPGGTFAEPVENSTWAIPQAVGDFDGDGMPDLAVWSGGSVSVVRGLGGGRFEAPMHTGANGTPMVVADLDGDGTLDVVGVRKPRSGDASGGISVRRGLGDGTFAAPVRYEAGAASSRVIVADVNRDGVPDLLVATLIPNQKIPPSDGLSVLLGAGGGAFAAAMSSRLDGAALDVGDLDGDGTPDLIVEAWDYANSRPVVGLRPGAGDGTFGDPVKIDVGARYTSVTIANVDGDGQPDLVVVHADDDQVSVLRGVPGRLPGAPMTYPTSHQPRGLELADLNGDGKPEILIGSLTGDVLGVLLNRGDGTYAAQVSYPVAYSPESLIAIGDLNGDRRVDVAAATGRRLAVLLGAGDGTLAPAAYYYVPDGASVAIGDLDGDGRGDLITEEYVLRSRCLR